MFISANTINSVKNNLMANIYSDVIELARDLYWGNISWVHFQKLKLKLNPSLFTNLLVLVSTSVMARSFNFSLLKTKTRNFSEEVSSLYHNAGDYTITNFQKFCSTIDLIHKWRPIYYSFIFMLISLPSLVSMCKIRKNVCSKMRLGRLISMNIKE